MDLLCINKQALWCRILFLSGILAGLIKELLYTQLYTNETVHALYVREVIRKTKWRFLMEFSMKEGGGGLEFH